MSEVNSFKYDSINKKVAEHFGFDFRGGITTRDRQKFLESLPRFSIFNHVSVYHMIEGVMSGSYEDLNFLIYNYSFIPATRTGGINIFREADDFFCVQVPLNFHHEIQPTTGQPNVVTKFLNSLFPPAPANEDKYKECILKVDPKIYIEATGNRLLVFKRETLSLEKKILLIKDSVSLAKMIDTLK